MVVGKASPQLYGSVVATEDQPLGLHRRVLASQVGSYSELDATGKSEHREWRLRTITRLESASKVGGRRRAERAVDLLAQDLLRVSAILDRSHGTPDLGNKTDPVDELVYIILARRTREAAYQSAYQALKARYEIWEDLSRAPLAEIEEIIRPSGLASRKAQSLKFAIGQLIDRFGVCTLQPTTGWSDEEVLSFLCELPEIGPKSAACVMVCSLDRPAFAVDAHVGRVLERIGVFSRVGIELVGTDHKVKQRLLWDAVPPALRYVLHVNLLVHGRETCLPARPRCSACPIVDECGRGRVTRGSSSRLGK